MKKSPGKWVWVAGALLVLNLALAAAIPIYWSLTIGPIAQVRVLP